MRLTALVVAAGLLWPISVLSETTTHDTIIFVLGKDLFGFCSDRSANSPNEKTEPQARCSRLFECLP
jgi:hypothetical protein